jgi:hypothetical protein
MPTIPLAPFVTRLGMLYVTRKAANRLNTNDALDCLERHIVGDYGEVDDVDWKTNDMARKYGFPVVSSYVDRKKNRFLIVTEADGCATTILLPEEY